MAFATRLPKVRDHSEHFNERTWMCYHQAPPWVGVVAHVGDAGQAKPHLEHNPLSLLGTCHAMPLRKLNDPVLILFLSDTYGGRVHDKRIADATPYPLPAQSRLLQDLGFLAFTLPQVEILMPTKKPRGEELTRDQERANQALNQRRLRIEHVNSSVKRCRIVKDRIRLWKEGVRDLVMELC